MSDIQVLHARHEHGGHPVYVVPPEGEGKPTYRVDWGDREEVYDSGRKLVRALYNGGSYGEGTRDPGMSLDRYFRIGKHRPALVTSPLEMFPMVEPASIALKPAPVKKIEVRKIVRRPKAPIVFNPHPMIVGVKGKIGKPLESGSWARRLGIDLENRSGEVRKLLFAGFGRLIASKGYDPEDVYQEVLRGILARNYGTCPWDPSKSKFGHYVHMICGCVLKNYHRKQSRRAEFEQLGAYGLDGDGEYGMLDAAEVPVTYSVTQAVSSVPADQVSMNMAVNSLGGYLQRTGHRDRELAIRVLPLVGAGMTRGEIASQLGADVSRVGKALSLIRKTAVVWREDQGL